MKKKKKNRTVIVRILRLILGLQISFWMIIGFLCLLYTFINPPVTPLMLQRYLFRGHDFYKREYIPLEDIPKPLIRYTLALEDPNFYKHFGFEWIMIKEARARNAKAGKIRFGASTISNQVARTVFLTTHRNYFRKILEAQVTVIMEIILSKDRMLELYFNYVEWGRGIYGVETASRVYYGKSARRLTSEQSLRMVAVLTNPIKYSPHDYHRSASARQRYNSLQRSQ